MRYFLVLAGAFALGGCSDVSAKLSVARLGAGTGAAQALSASDRVPTGVGAFAYATLDGIRLSVHDMELEGDGVKSRVAIDEVIEFGIDTEQLSFTADVGLNVGTYNKATLRFDGAYEIKATCRTETRMVYTTAEAVKTVNCSTTDCATFEPDDYDFFRYEFIYITNAEGPQDTSDAHQESTWASFSIAEGSAPRIAVLIDASYLAACYDGTSNLSDPDLALEPFSFHPNDPSLQVSDFFADDQPNFGISYLPLFVDISEDQSATLPQAETYVSGATEAAVTADELDYSKLLVTTYAFSADGRFIAARARNFDHASVDLNQFFDLKEAVGDTLDFFNGEFYWNGATDRFIHDRLLRGFQRTAEDGAAFSTTYEDGPECGETIDSEFGNIVRACTEGPSTIWWKRIPR